MYFYGLPSDGRRCWLEFDCASCAAVRFVQFCGLSPEVYRLGMIGDFEIGEIEGQPPSRQLTFSDQETLAWVINFLSRSMKTVADELLKMVLR